MEIKRKRYGNNNQRYSSGDKTESTNRSTKRASGILKKIGMFAVAFTACIVATASSSWLSSEKVIAVGGVPIITNAVTKQEIEDAKTKRDNAKAEAEKASNMVDQLNDEKNQLTGELARVSRSSLPTELR